MAENDVEENVFPTDWDGLAGYDDVMAGLPEMVQAESFSLPRPRCSLWSNVV